jgi:hypothetical protein
MPYSNKEHTVSNVNYLNKDFNSFKSTLIEYAKTYYPNTYRDFNETSPGMMLIEMSAYVGDVLSFYIDQQYREMMLPLAEERRNVINLANMLGYKVKPTSPAYVNLKFTNTVGTVTNGDVISPDYPSGHTLSKGAEVQSSTDSTIKFETLDYIDFSFSSSSDPEPKPIAFDSNEVVTAYDLVRTVKAMSAETKTKTFTVGTPSKFLTLTLSDTNVIDITSITDSNNNTWYESDFLAQEYIPSETHYSDDGGRATAYNDGSSGTEVVPVPYTLQYTRTTKRFVTQVNEDNTTSLVFGNGILRSGQTIQSEFLQTAQVGIIIPGEINPFSQAIDPLTSDNKSTLGETPAHTTLTVTYRVGGGIASNVVSSDLTTLTSAVSNVAVTNDAPAYGGSSGETIEEIRRRAKAYFATQNRCVTQEDYEARVLAMPAKFGNIAKVLVSRNEDEGISIEGQSDDNPLNNINIHILSYDNNKSLVRTGEASPLRTNIKNYLDQYRIMTDEIIIDDGFIINFGVAFDVVAHKTVNKNDVKIRCIDVIRNYFNIDKMQFRQALYISDLEYELMGIEGVRSVNGVILTQDFTDEDFDASGDTLWDYDLSNLNGGANTGNYGWAYSFSGADQNSEGVILPSTTPAVFELKNPNENIKGIVR